MASAAELSGDRFMSALSAYLASRHDVALRLLSEVDKEEAASEKAEEEALRDEALSALVQRNYEAAHEATAQLSDANLRDAAGPVALIKDIALAIAALRAL
jgi:hypothetical protein